VHQFLPVTLLLSLEEALIFLHGHDDHMRPAPAFDDNGLVILHSVPHQFAKADTRLSRAYHTAHATTPINQLITQLDYTPS
jgi:hypothetical protein